VNLLANLVVDVTAGLVGVFAGALLALWMDRRARARQAEEVEAELREDLAKSRKLVISSVVKNTSEAKRLRALLASNEDRTSSRSGSSSRSGGPPRPSSCASPPSTSGCS
jgi:hypothetical protein